MTLRVAYLGPEGTFTQAAALSAPGSHELQLEARETIHDTVLAVTDGGAERAVVPIENSLEGSVNVTLDALVFDAEVLAGVEGEVDDEAEAMNWLITWESKLGTGNNTSP